MTTVADRWWKVRDTVVAACARAGRDPSEITIVAVAKKHTAAAVEEAAAAGVTDVGENYAQELVDKAAQVKAHVWWHFIGSLQRNKCKLVVGEVALIHTVDSVRLAEEIDKRAAAVGVVQPVLIEVNIAGEDTKGGVAPANAHMLLGAMRGLANLRCDGLMTMPPPGDLELARRSFASLRELRDQLANADRPLPILSMGMSGDYEAAIAEGATHLRIGTAIFGERVG
ncbi:MAG TPA: YggS family pyridoxal phosphate-dependent enzyme [Kofleriaceae bacterium]|nr:YggS family pyridoxal phosphate-dependent enzyme [Kofleriaceae bacterium]